MANRSAASILKLVPKSTPHREELEPFLERVAKSGRPYGIGARWTNPASFDLKSKSAKALVPFLSLADGGVVAFWLRAKDDAPIVHFDSEGGTAVVGADLQEFLLRVGSGRSNVPDLDEANGKLSLPARDRKGKGKGKPPSLAILQKELLAFCKEGSTHAAPAVSPDGEKLRSALHVTAKRMLRDGLSRTYTTRSDWWSLAFRVKRKGKALDVRLLDYGA